MASTSPFIPNRFSYYANNLPGDLNIALNFVSILRLLLPKVVIPAVSSFELLSKGGQMLALKAGANALTLHDATPALKEKLYIIYDKNRYRPKKRILDKIRKEGWAASFTSLIKC